MNNRHILSVTLGAGITTSYFFLSFKYMLVSSSFVVFSGVFGGLIAAFLDPYEHHHWYTNSFWANLAAIPVTAVTLTVYDLLLTSKYPGLVILDQRILSALNNPPQDFVARLSVYGIRAVVIALFGGALFLTGGIVGGFIGAYLQRVLPFQPKKVTIRGRT